MNEQSLASQMTYNRSINDSNNYEAFTCLCTSCMMTSSILSRPELKRMTF